MIEPHTGSRMRPARRLSAALLVLALAAGLTPAQAQDRDRLTRAGRAQARAALAGTAAAAPAAWNELMGAGDTDGTVLDRASASC
jgi:hypothetical protein